jgi:AcrR family transcriptional regulator
MAGRRRLGRDERRQQIIDVTLESVAECGVRGTTLSRIAAGVGVTTPALYAHFPNRKEILLAALDVLFEHRTAIHRQTISGTAVERLREIARSHAQLVVGPNERSVLELFEFIAAPPEEGLRETLGAKHLLLVKDIADLVREGQREGSIRTDVDPEQTAWMIIGRAWSEDITHLLGVADAWTESQSNTMLDLILGSIAVSPLA